MIAAVRKVTMGACARTPAEPSTADTVSPTPSRVTALSHLRELVSGRSFQLDDFDLRATVGVGTFGRVRVVKVKGSADRTPLALKIMKKSEVLRLKQLEHVKAETAILAKIHHPFIVNLLATFQDETRLYLVLEYVNGGELFSRLRNEGRLPELEARFDSAEICLAFEYLHSKNVIYRDLKPENLLIDSDGFIKVTDFGFAKVIEDRTWTLCGTPEYLAPEIIQSKGHGKGVDWWALGVLIFEMLAGYPPFYDENAFGIYQKVLKGTVDFPRHFDMKVQSLVKRLLTHDRSKRYGCLKGGVEDIKGHKWYKGFDWEMLLSRQLKPLYVPKLKAADDTSMFDRYPESTEASAQAVSASDQQRFDGFIVDVDLH
mmetsp:Transcript_108653/g.308018  ORF Transcript_108653/g.308018 Transcript_108653/m.308018 type:complete len:372 (+) Transcript_108653:189-1304(+)